MTRTHAHKLLSARGMSVTASAAEVRRLYFIWGPGYHPREETLGEGDFVCGSLLIINLGIRQLFWNWLSGQGA